MQDYTVFLLKSRARSKNLFLMNIYVIIMQKFSNAHFLDTIKIRRLRRRMQKERQRRNKATRESTVSEVRFSYVCIYRTFRDVGSEER